MNGAQAGQDGSATRPPAGRAGPRRFGLRTYLMLLLGLLSSLPVATLGLTDSLTRQRDALAGFDDRASFQANAVGEALEHLLLSRAESLGMTASSIGALGLDHPTTPQLIEDQRSTAQFDAVYLADVSGRSLVIASGRPNPVDPGSQVRVDYSDRDYFLELMRTGQTTFSRVQRGRTSGVANLMIAAPVRQGRSRGLTTALQGLVVGGVRLEQLLDRVTHLTAANTELRTLVMDEHAVVLVDVGGELAPLSPVPPSTVFTHGCGPSVRTGHDELGRSVRAHCRVMGLPGHQWEIWTSATQATVDTGARHARNATLAASLAALLLGLAIAYILSCRLTGQAKRVQRQAAQVAGGDLSVRPPAPGRFVPDEWARITSDVHAVLEQLESSATDNHRLVSALQQANARLTPLAAAWAQVEDAVEITDTHGVIQFVNPAYEAMFGVRREDVVGHTSALFRSGGDRPANPGHDLPTLERCTAGAMPWKGETWQDLATGRSVFQCVTASPIRDDDDGAVSRLIISRRDRTAVRMAQRAAAHAERLSTIGTLAAGMAHEINNPLTYIRGNLSMLQMEPEALPADIRGELLETALEGVGRIEGMVRTLLRLARKGDGTRPTEHVPTDLHSVVDEAARLVRTKVETRAQLTVDMPTDLRVLATGSELVQVVLNLLTNAAQAMPDGESHRRRIQVRGGREVEGDAEFCFIDVIDNGPGMPKAIMDSVFEPFFSTKEPGKGTGLGLSISRRIADEHRGMLEVCSEPGEGTAFRLSIPTAPAPGGPTVLVVDDDPSVTAMIQRFLGEGVIVVHDAAAAREAIRSVPSLRVVLADVLMPVENGLDLYEHLRVDREELAARTVFFTSGIDPNSPVGRRLHATGRPIVGKDRLRTELKSTVSRLLEE